MLRVEAMFVAKEFYLASGYGVDEYKIASFDKALVMAGLHNYNLVRVSSIIPPSAIQSQQINYPSGSILFTAYATYSTNRDEQIASSIVAAIPKQKNCAGVIMEYSCVGEKKQAIHIARKLAIDALQRRGISEYDLVEDGIDAKGKTGYFTTTFCAIALM